MKIYFLRKSNIQSFVFDEGRFEDLKELYQKRQSDKVTEILESTVELSYYEKGDNEVREVSVNDYESYERLTLNPLDNDKENSNLTEFIGEYSTLIDSYLVYVLNEWKTEQDIYQELQPELTEELKEEKIEQRKNYLETLKEEMSKEEFNSFKDFHVKDLEK